MLKRLTGFTMSGAGVDQITGTMTRSQSSKRMLNKAAAIVLVASLLGAAALVAVELHDSNEFSGLGLAGFLLFFVATLAVLACSAVFFEDLRRIGLSRTERRRWVGAWFLFAPLALGVYWWRYVRNSEVSERPQSPEAPMQQCRPALPATEGKTWGPWTKAFVAWQLGVPLLFIAVVAVIVLLEKA